MGRSKRTLHLVGVFLLWVTAAPGVCAQIFIQWHEWQSTEPSHPLEEVAAAMAGTYVGLAVGLTGGAITVAILSRRMRDAERRATAEPEVGEND